jgi:NADH-quinone oxidoreductase subunit N
MSRPLAVAQEAGVKYFFLGAMAAAVMLFGFSYLYGTTGLTQLDQIENFFTQANHQYSTLQILALVMMVAGFAFKMAAVPLHAYAGDVYQGAATPVTAFLAFVPKTTGFIALIRILSVVGGPQWIVPDVIIKMMWVIAVLTMTFGNVLGLLQTNIKRVLAYSSVAHTGYMLVGITAMLAAKNDIVAQQSALQGVLFYLASYGIMNSAAFGVLMLLPSRAVDMGFAAPGRATESRPPATSAETFEDLAGQGRRHLGLGLAMAVACFSLTGIPLTVGFWGKFFLIKPALAVGTNQMNWLVIITMVNAAISAGYYLRIVGTMFLRTDPATEEAMEADIAESPKLAHPISDAMPVVASVALSVVLTLFYGTILPATDRLSKQARDAAVPSTLPPVAAQSAEAAVAAK